MSLIKIAVTTGDPAGIGPEITAKALRYYKLDPDLIYIVLGRSDRFLDGNEFELIRHPDEATKPGKIYLISIDDSRISPGKPSGKSGKVAYKILLETAGYLRSGDLDAVVTCPVSKEMIRESEPGFIGHTEFFAHQAGVSEVIMSFWGPVFNLALLTTHLPLCEVNNNLDRVTLSRKLRLISKEVKKIIPEPRLALLALNPHAGEAGAFGQEDLIAGECLRELHSDNIRIDGPFPADTFFVRKADDYDVIISAYHDQGLIPFKMLSADQGVNVTLGLPFVRTSVDHGTAFDLAGQGLASEKSLIAALEFCEQLLLEKKHLSNLNYTAFADYYDHYMSHVNYEDWVNFILRNFTKRFGHSPEMTLELACGTASVSSLLVKRGLKVEASDISREMLNVASSKPFPPNLICSSMLDPLPVERYDLVLLIFDSFNYLLEDSQVTKLFSNVYQSLKIPGMFIFDVTTQKNCEENFDGFVNLQDCQDNYMIHQSELDYSSSIQTTRLTFFDRKGFLFQRRDEVHEQKIFKTGEIKEMITRSPFRLSGIFSPGYKWNLLNRDPEVLDKSYTRLFFILEKNALPE